MKRRIFHITHINNLPAILDQGGLWCDRDCGGRGVAPVNIAYTDLKAARAVTQVPVCKGGTLADYVPFYFAPRSPMLYVIHRGGVAGYTFGQQPVVHLVVNLETLHERGLPFAFTDGHAAIAFTQFFEDWKDLERIDWALMKEKYWNNTEEDGDRKRRRQAEFLVHRFFPWELVEEIGVCTPAIREQTERLLARSAHKPPVNVVPGWYYE